MQTVEKNQVGVSFVSETCGGAYTCVCSKRTGSAALLIRVVPLIPGMQQPCLGEKTNLKWFLRLKQYKHQETEVLFSRNQLLYTILRGGNAQGFLVSKYPFVPFFTTPTPRLERVISIETFETP